MLTKVAPPGSNSIRGPFGGGLEVRGGEEIRRRPSRPKRRRRICSGLGRASRAASYRHLVLWVRLALAAFVVLWVFDFFGVQGTVPVWIPFLIGLGLELNLFLGASRATTGSGTRGRAPLEIDRARYGYAGPDELVLVRDGDRDVWVPYCGESADELEELIDSADDEEDEAIRVEPPARRPFRRLLVGLAVLTALGAVVWAAGKGGWDGLDADERAAATKRFSTE